MMPEKIAPLVVAFPEFAAWIIVALMIALVYVVWAGIRWAVKMLMGHLTKQDTELARVNKTLIEFKDKAGEAAHDVRELLHSHDKRILVLETWKKHADLKLWGRRYDDQEADGTSDAGR